MGHKAVINSRLYDTKTALYIGGKANYWYPSSKSTLYRKKTGEYFIYNVLCGCLPDSMKEALMAKQKNSIIPLRRRHWWRSGAVRTPTFNYSGRSMNEKDTPTHKALYKARPYLHRRGHHNSPNTSIL